jgi:hypothetical protein
MTWNDADREPVEHECPTPLERPADEWDIGGMVFTPAGRWETVTGRTPHTQVSAQVEVTTDRCVWTFWRSDKAPYIDGWRTGRRYVLVNEGHSHMEVVVDAERGFGGRGHILVSARQIRGTGWQITDQPAGSGELEYATKPSKAAARAEMSRRARAHAKRLGVPLWRPGTAGGAR